MAGYGGSQLLRLAGQLILARMLLTPQAFGLVALVSVFLGGLEMLSDLGLGTDVVQHPRGDEPLFVDTAFLIQAGRGAILWAIAAALAYPFASFYHQPAIRSMIFVAAASIGLRSLASGSVWTMTRHVQLGKLTMLTLGGDAAGLAVSVIWAIVSPTAWALVAGRVAGSAVYAIGSHLVADRAMRLEWDSRAAKEIFAFGTGMFLSSATYFLSGEAERLVVGKFITVAELGCFSLALAMSWAPSRAIQQVISQVFFPMVARALRKDRTAAVDDYRKARLLLFYAGSAVACGFILFGPWVVHLLLGAKYADAGWMLQLLGFRAALELFSSSTTSMLFAVGVSRYAAIGNAAKAGFLCIGLAVAFGKFGFREAVWVMAFSQLANYLPQFWGLSRVFGVATKIEGVCFLLFLSVTAGAALIVGVAS
jgi:O-antigen/teichoic acid export membrane protein